MPDISPTLLLPGLKLALVAILLGFLPLSAYSYYRFRLVQRRLEVRRILDKLGITSRYAKVYIHDIGPWHYLMAVGFAAGVSATGLVALFLGLELGIDRTPTLPLIGAVDVATTAAADWRTYQHHALLVYGMGFLGAYLWGLQYILRRYSMNDLIPAAYYHVGLRMIFAALIALLIYHTVAAPAASEGGAAPAAAFSGWNNLLPVLAFVIGSFPQRGVRWLVSRLEGLGRAREFGVPPLPLDLIEGVTDYDRFRLEELGIDSCYDLATADYIPLLLRTPYGARELIDWILQAKLCVRFGPHVQALREQGYRIITDLADLDEATMEDLAKTTPLNLFALRQASRAVREDCNIERLQRAALLLGRYWESAEEAAPESATAPDPS